MPETTDESKRNRRTAKRILAIGLPLLLIAGVGVGYAYWTTSGSGNGTAATAAGSTVTVTPGLAPSGLAPGSGAHALSATVDSGGASVRVTAVTVTIASITQSAAGLASGDDCTVGDYTISPMTAPAAPVDLTAASPTATFTGGSISFGGTNSAALQDGCKGASLGLTYTAS